jgi:hypothetical protein
MVLNDESGNPEVVCRDGDSFFPEMEIELRVMMRGLIVGQENGDARAIEEALKISGIGRFLIPGGEPGAEFTQHDERQAKLPLGADKMHAVSVAAHEVTIGVRVEGKVQFHASSSTRSKSATARSKAVATASRRTRRRGR